METQEWCLSQKPTILKSTINKWLEQGRSKNNFLHQTIFVTLYFTCTWMYGFINQGRVFQCQGLWPRAIRSGPLQEGGRPALILTLKSEQASCMAQSCLDLKIKSRHIKNARLNFVTLINISLIYVIFYTHLTLT